MTSFQSLFAIFPENAITRAERSYQTRSARKPRRWRRWINRILMWLAITVSLIMFGGLLIASITQRDPSPIAKAFNSLPTNLLLFFAFSYHFYLMFQTISLAANSIIREKEGESWERLVLTGVNARQIVCGKWWATIQRQLPRYLLLGLLRAGVTASSVISFLSPFINRPLPYQSQVQLAHPITILIVVLFGIVLTLANLALSAACGVMGSAVSKRRTFAIVRGFAIQIVISLIPVLIAVFVSTRPNFYATGSFVQSIYIKLVSSIFSLADNGLYLLSGVLSFRTSSSVDLIISAVFVFVIYALLIGFVLWRAEKRVARALASPAD